MIQVALEVSGRLCLGRFQNKKGQKFMEQDDFLWFQNWCKIHDEKEWKHAAMKIQIATLDNPGWSLKMDLEKTELENQKFQKIEINRSDDDWMFCAVKDNKFEVACSPTNLLETFHVFRNWAEHFLDRDEKQLLEQKFIAKNELAWLQYWFYIHCNGDWEHASGIKFEVSDTSGWVLKINLDGTELENEIFQNIETTQTETDLVTCDVKNHQFEARCGLTNLHEAIGIFRNWAEHFLVGTDRKHLELLQKKGLHFTNHDDFEWLQKWHYIHCNGTWEHTEIISVKTLENAGWLLTINIKDTELEGKSFRKIRIDNSDDEWIQCDVKNNKFEGRCGPTNLSDLLAVFRNWTKPY